jgi:hypothetical protein
MVQNCLDIGQDNQFSALWPLLFQANFFFIYVLFNSLFLGNACSPLIGNFTGKIVLVAAGVCQNALKTYHAQLAGAVGVISNFFLFYLYF